MCSEFQASPRRCSRGCSPFARICCKFSQQIRANQLKESYAAMPGQGERAQTDSRQKIFTNRWPTKVQCRSNRIRSRQRRFQAHPVCPGMCCTCARMSPCALLAVLRESDGLSLGQNVDAITMRLRIVEAFKETDSDGSGTVEPVGLNPAWRAVCCVRAQKQAPSYPVVVPLVLTVGARVRRRS